MPDLREVFEMVKQQTEPDQDSWAEQERRIRRAGRRRRVGALALVAAILGVAAVVVVSTVDGSDPTGVPASNGPSFVPPSASGPSVEPPAGAEFALLDISTGDTTGTGIVPAGSEVDVSPNGAKMTYVGDGDVVHVANVDGSADRSFEQTRAPGGAIAPRWSPDGTSIVYQGKEAGEFIGNLFVLDVRSGDVQQITHLKPIDAGLYYMAPAFSADGSSVVFTMPTVVAGQQMRWDIWSVPAQGGQPKLVEPHAIGADAQPGGDLIAFSRINGEENIGSLYVARSDGSNARKVADGQIWLPRWSPDGSQIGYSDETRDGLFVVDVATGETRQVFDHAEWPEWVDRDTMIIDLSD